MSGVQILGIQSHKVELFVMFHLVPLIASIYFALTRNTGPCDKAPVDSGKPRQISVGKNQISALQWLSRGQNRMGKIFEAMVR